MPNLAQEAKSVLSALGISTLKKFGQNFMIDEEVLAFIVQHVDVTPGQTVLEIGPGLGFLTRALLKRFESIQPLSLLIAVERDRQFAGYLKKEFIKIPVQILEQDILSLNLKKDLKIDAPIVVVGNIPYNITSPILEWLIDQRKWVSSAVLTMQWEVAERLTAKPGTKIWGALSVFVQFYAEVEIAKKVSKECFSPSPNVDSAVVKLTFPKAPKIPVQNEENFFKLVRKAFQKRRKTILNALVDEKIQGLSKAPLRTTLQKAGIDPIRRPETLSMQDWARLSDCF